jgi:hypothetical protein
LDFTTSSFFHTAHLSFILHAQQCGLEAVELADQLTLLGAGVAAVLEGVDDSFHGLEAGEGVTDGETETD